MDRSTARSLIYNMLSLCHVYPDEKVYASITAGERMKEFRNALHILDEKIFDGYLGTFEQAPSGTEEGKQLAMAREYTRLFIAASPRVIAPPYGSFYLGKEGLDSEKTLSEVLGFYHKADFIPREDLHPDHVTDELEFMGILAGEESQASGNGKIKLEEMQMNFLSRFILPWVPTFCQKVAEHCRYPFYCDVSNLTKEFINFERNYLGAPEELNSWREDESATGRG
jgi:TorA maturation chaperone TorD